MGIQSADIAPAERSHAQADRRFDTLRIETGNIEVHPSGSSLFDLSVSNTTDPEKRWLCQASAFIEKHSGSMESTYSELLRMCNDAQQATPQGHLLNVLQGALRSDNSDDVAKV